MRIKANLRFTGLDGVFKLFRVKGNIYICNTMDIDASIKITPLCNKDTLGQLILNDSLNDICINEEFTLTGRVDAVPKEGPDMMDTYLDADIVFCAPSMKRFLEAMINNNIKVYDIKIIE